MTTLELPIGGMDCAACARKAQRALLKVQGVQKAEVLLNAEKAVVETDLTVASMDALRAAIEKVGFTVPAARSAEIEAPLAAQSSALQRQLFTILGVLFGVILFIVVAGEGLGLIDEVTERVPWWIGTAIVVAFGYTIFADVIRSALRGDEPHPDVGRRGCGTCHRTMGHCRRRGVLHAGRRVRRALH